MKKQIARFISLVFVFIFVIGGSSLCAAYESVEKATLSGKGTVTFPADSATVSFCIDTDSKKESEAREKSDAVLSLLRSHYGEISEDSYFSHEDPVAKRFFVSRCCSLKIKNAADNADIINSLVQYGVTSVNGICYFSENQGEYEKEALRLAVEDANAKAEALGLRLYPVEITDFGCYRSYGAENAAQNGYITLECSISAIYAQK